MVSQPVTRGFVSLSPMQQLVEANDTDDNWTGLSDPAARRKRQTRLNMRAHRRRKALEEANISQQEGLVACWDDQHQKVLYLPESQAKALNYDHTSPVIRQNSAGIIFPLSSDHLMILIQFNVMRAVAFNKRLLSALEPDGIFYNYTPGILRVLPTLVNVQQLPTSLHPTKTQSIIPHGGWIDIFPHPTWRDNFIQAEGRFNEYDLCSDILGGLFQGELAAECERRGIVVWSPPWDFNGWELSEGFVRKWGWSIKGCNDVLEATNKWRLLRGEKPLAFEC
ncbi:unnamed protein product [Clonostachys byssicola]|uniref:BZIP domain-containing protein n=1 Tax=Clonostachys byssicola TaxID=160290 RepID=A0A9N9UIF8_9HYPO|nr:unnamed protein product [Clonostachys byssicola]